MAIPTLEESRNTADTTGNSVTVLLPSGTAAGELLLVFVGHDTDCTAIDVTGGSGWTRLLDANSSTFFHYSLFAKVAAGGDTLTISDNGDDQDTACIAVRVSGHGVSNPSTDLWISNPSLGSTATVTPNALTPSGSTEDYLWIEWLVSDDTNAAAESFLPSTNFTSLGIVESAASTTAVDVAAAWRQLTTSSLAPGAMTINSAERNVSFVMAIPGGAAASSTTDAIWFGCSF